MFDSPHIAPPWRRANRRAPRLIEGAVHTLREMHRGRGSCDAGFFRDLATADDVADRCLRMASTV